MLILLPPSEGKAVPSRGKSLDLATLSHPSLTETRHRLLTTLVDLCRSDPDRARIVLGLSPGQADDVTRNSRLCTSPTASAGRIYTGVLYDALGLARLSPGAKRRATSRIAVTSALFGLVRLGDRIPSYRLGGGTTLPGVGTVAAAWRRPLGDVLTAEAERGLLVDLRSGTYAGFWKPAPGSGSNIVSLRVLQDNGGVRTIVSHFNKATKGRLVADLLEDGANPGSARAFAAALTRLGWQIEQPTRDPRRLDVIVTDAH